MTSVKVERWDTHEVALEAEKEYENPFCDVQVTAQFRHVDSGREIQIDGFHDGGSTWRIRMMPLEIGVWEYTASSKEPSPARF